MNAIENIINASQYISRDLSWIKFNSRVLDQVYKKGRTLSEQLKFLAISSTNADEFFMIRVGSLYNYIDNNQEKKEYSGLNTSDFKKKLYSDYKEFAHKQDICYLNHILPQLHKHYIKISLLTDLPESYRNTIKEEYENMIPSFLTPARYDKFHPLIEISNKILTYGIVSQDKEKKKVVSFVQMPLNINKGKRFAEVHIKNTIHFIPIENIIKECMGSLFRNVEIISQTLCRITRNGDFPIEDLEDSDQNFVDEMRRRIKKRSSGRVVRIQTIEHAEKLVLKALQKELSLDDDTIIYSPSHSLLDYQCLWEISKHPQLSEHSKANTSPNKQNTPNKLTDLIDKNEDIFHLLEKKSYLLHHPYDSFEAVLHLLETAAEDTYVTHIKITIYRLSKNSRIIEALKRAKTNGKDVTVLFEIKARFDEESNMQAADTLEKSGCYVIRGIGSQKTHTKLLLIIKEENNKIKKYVHLASGNYNESTSNQYTDIGLLTSAEEYTTDITHFFIAITGHSFPEYKNIITAPSHMRKEIITLIEKETENAKNKLPSGIAIKINSLQDKESIDALYRASQAGVPIKLIVRGVCCIKPGIPGLSENISVKSIVGEYLEHARIYYFHNNGNPKIYGGSADIMVRSFDKRIESLFCITDDYIKKQCISILHYNFQDNFNSYELKSDGTYQALAPKHGQPIFNCHEQFYNVSEDMIHIATIF
ncbi:MAG: polyphosphate kinase 1 [Chitinophagaceae bacterium]|nr:polyphosphate kinase 1 [Chitinophagaceae bacterium]